MYLVRVEGPDGFISAVAPVPGVRLRFAGHVIGLLQHCHGRCLLIW